MEKTQPGLEIEVAHAKPAEQVIISLEVPEGTRVKEAITRSGILGRFPEIDLDRNKLGIFSKPTKPDAVLRHGDRVEIYRPLLADPKEVRRQRAAQGKRLKKGA
ncbi:MAG: RnfH family protein [Gammaproteobacteria bacterium]|nr:RnfH family protein [Gammaproteobacteria bacterium]